MSQANADSAQNQTAGGEADAPASESIQETTTTPEAGNEGQGGSGEAEASAQQEQSTPSMEERIGSVDDVAAYEAMMAEVQQNPNAFENPTEDAHPDDQQQAQAEGEEAPPEGEGAEEQAEAASEEGAEESEGESEEEGAESAQEDESEGGDKPPQFRLRPTEKVDAEALRIMKAAEAAQSPISLSEALSIAKRNLGIEEKPVAKPDESAQDVDNEGDVEDDSEDPTQGITLTEAKAELKELRKKHSQALRDGDLDEAADVMDQIGETEDLIELVAEREQKESQTARQQHDSAFEASVARATELFPDFGETDTEFYQRCTEIDEALRDTEDPRYYEPDKPLMIARMAAKELNVAPARKGQKPAAKKPVQQATQQQTPQQKASTSPQPPRTEKPGQLPAASGASRTAGAPTGAAASLAEQVEKISSTEEFERLAKQVHAETR